MKKGASKKLILIALHRSIANAIPMKSAFVALLLLFALTAAHSQTIGLNAGVNFATQKIEYSTITVKPGSIVLPNINAFVNFHLEGKITGQVEAGYSAMGHSEDASYSQPEQKFSYLTMGTLVKYYPIKKLSILAGPQGGILFEGSYSRNVLGTREVYDFGIVTGVEGYLSQSLGMGVRYYHGLTNISSTINAMAEYYNRAFHVYLIFRIKGRQMESVGY